MMTHEQIQQMFNVDSDGDDKFWTLYKFAEFSATLGGLLVQKPSASYTRVRPIIDYVR